MTDSNVSPVRPEFGAGSTVVCDKRARLEPAHGPGDEWIARGAYPAATLCGRSAAAIAHPQIRTRQTFEERVHGVLS